MQRVLVVDNGAYSLKAGWAGEGGPRVVIPNAAGRAKRSANLLIGDEGETMVRDPSQLSWLRPLERGVLVDPLLEGLIWDRAFGPSHLNVDSSSMGTTGLVLSAPPFMPAALEATLDELVFERYGFGSLYRAPAAQLTAFSIASGSAFAPFSTSSSFSNNSSSGNGFGAAPALATPDPLLHFPFSGTGIVIDSGYSATTVTPFLHWRPLVDGIVRIDVGGKALTNALKEAVSYRQYNMMDDTWLVNRVKERLCFVAKCFDLEMEVARRLSAPGVVARVGRAQAQAMTMTSGAAARPAAAAGASTSASGSSNNSNATYHTYARRRPLPSSSASASSLASPSGGAAPSAGGASAASSLALSRGDGTGVGIRREYVLPDYVAITRGYVKGEAAEDPYLQARAALAQALATREGREDISTAGAGAGASDVAMRPTSGSIAKPPSGAPSSSTSSSSSSNSTTGTAVQKRQQQAGESRKRPRPPASPAIEADNSDKQAAADAKDDSKKTKTAAGTSSNSSSIGIKKTAKRKAATHKATKETASAPVDKKEDNDDEVDDDDDDDSSISEEEDDDSEEEDDDDGYAAGDYKGKASSSSSSSSAPPPARTTSKRAASSGVRDLTSSLKRSGVLEEGVDDELEAAGIASSESAASAASSSGSVSERQSAYGYKPGLSSSRSGQSAPSAYGSVSGGSGLTTSDGKVLPPESDLQTLVLCGERISIPELLFQPSLAGLKQAGLPGAVAQSIARCPPAIRPCLWSSVILTGGNALLPGLEARLTSELTSLAPPGAEVRAWTPAE